ncbi:hypothetical protein [Olleya aquimaris]|uniref:Uncharacterized protein n=1 Tax=Olleya aquimaris TaxID=639310 RepID=A0A327RR07_9FLAO|nr:hypothetical protein [Olleya aquimaris]RAJ18033.1 hypothetical protein LY08_00305 [Olleya aquimaris]
MKTRIKYQVGSASIQHILVLSDDLESDLQFLKTKTNNTAIHSWIDQKLAYTLAFKLKSLSLLDNMTIKHKKRSRFKTALRMFWFNLKRLFYKNEDRKIIKQCLLLSSSFIHEINKEIGSGIHSETTYSLLYDFRTKVFSNKDQINLNKLIAN